MGAVQDLRLTTVRPARGASTTEAQVNVAIQVAEQMADYLVSGGVTNALNMPSLSAEEAPLHRLGSGQWEKAKRKAAEQVRDTAAELAEALESGTLPAGVVGSDGAADPAEEYAAAVAALRPGNLQQERRCKRRCQKDA